MLKSKTLSPRLLNELQKRLFANEFGLPAVPHKDLAAEAVTCIEKAVRALVSNIRRRPTTSVDELPYSSPLNQAVLKATGLTDATDAPILYRIVAHFTYRVLLNMRKTGTLFTKAQPKPSARKPRKAA